MLLSTPCLSCARCTLPSGFRLVRWRLIAYPYASTVCLPRRHTHIRRVLPRAWRSISSAVARRSPERFAYIRGSYTHPEPPTALASAERDPQHGGKASFISNDEEVVAFHKGNAGHNPNQIEATKTCRIHDNELDDLSIELPKFSRHGITRAKSLPVLDSEHEQNTHSAATTHLPDPSRRSIGATNGEEEATRSNGTTRPLTKQSDRSLATPVPSRNKHARQAGRNTKGGPLFTKTSIAYLPRKRQSTSAYLWYALEETGNSHALPEKDKRRADPMTQNKEDFSLHAILARYVLASTEIKDTAQFRLVASDVERPLVSTADLKHLSAQDYTIGDLADWASLITAKENHSYVTKLFGHSQTEGPSPPIFLFMLILHRRVITTRTLQVLVGYAWNLLELRRTASQDLDESTVFKIAVRLLRHAQHVWPEAIVNIAQIVSTYIHYRKASSELDNDVEDPARFARISTMYNRILSVLAEPISQNHFKSSVYQETAQFDLLHAMANQEPPLRISKDGYQALTRVLLSRPKNERERDWTSLQAESWPPWKQARTGVDEAKDVAYGSSRAAISVRRMMESGYGQFAWGSVANIYAGRDVDGSPVVQTRTLLPRSGRIATEARLWEARVRTTRTIREAWACFLSYKDSVKVRSPLVYTAMIVKLLLGQKPAKYAKEMSKVGYGRPPSSTSSASRPNTQPGDALEPLAEPVYPGDLTYIAAAPPKPHELFQEMLDQGVRPRHGDIAQYLKHANTIEDGIFFLDMAGPPYADWLRILTSGDKIDPASVQDIHEKVFNNFVALLCTVPRSPLRLISVKVRHDRSQTSEGKDWIMRRQSPPIHAIRLLLLRQSIKRQLWAALLAALGDGQVQLTIGGRAESMEAQAVLKLQTTRRVLAMMKRLDVAPDTACLMAVSTTVENAVLASHNFARVDHHQGPTTDWLSVIDALSALPLHDIALRPWRREVEAEAAQLESQGPRLLRKLFRSILSGNPADGSITMTPLPHANIPPIPRLLEVPTSAELHAYVRALGVLGDHEGIWSLVQWMVEHHESLWVQVLEQGEGKRKWSTLLTAIRVFLECPHYDKRVKAASASSITRPASEELIALVKERINSVQDWSWPDREMVWQYTGRHGAVNTHPPQAPSISDYI